MSRVLLLHGIHSAGRGGPGKFIPALQAAGHEIHPHDCSPYTLLATTWLRPNVDHERARELVKLLAGERVHVIAHSNGCRLAALAMKEGAAFDTVIFFGAAWPAHAAYPEGAFTKLYMVYSKTDPAILIGSALPRHEFGSAGRNGYRGLADNRIVNVSATPHLHTTYFRWPWRDRWARWVVERLAV